MIRVTTKALGGVEFPGAVELVQRGDLAVALRYGQDGPEECGGVPLVELLAWSREADPA